jgi:hypothetical protein
MKFLYLILALILPLTALAGNGSANLSSTKVIGGNTSQPGNITVPNTDRTYFTLFAGVATSVNGHFYPFYKNGALYQVPSGKTAACENIQIIGTASNEALSLMSATATFAQNATSATGAVYQCGTDSVPCMLTIGPAGSTTLPGATIIPGGYDFAATTWPGFQPITGSADIAVQLQCREI